MREELERRGFEESVKRQLNEVSETDLAKPPIAHNYPEIAARLLFFEQDGVRAFTGGPLDHRRYGINTSWLVPVEVEDKDGFSNFHLIYLNCNPKIAKDAPAYLSFARDVGLKVGDLSDPQSAGLHKLIMAGDLEPKIIIRPSMVGSLYYPRILSLLDMPSSDTVVSRLKKLVQVTGLNLQAPSIPKRLVDNLTIEFELYNEYPSFFMGVPERIYSEVGVIYAYSLVSPDDPWKYIQLFTDKPLEKMDKRPQIVLRTDSGCDIGQLYRDAGCDCRDQLIDGLKKIHRGDHNDLGGIVVHIPTQDGRGYGMNTKMETEGLKRAFRMPSNDRDDYVYPLNTVEAGEKVFGDYWDPRTFDGTARILTQIGFESVIVYTDNKAKVECLRRGGLKVEQRPTGTKGNEYNSQHIQAKHRTDKYFHQE